MQDLTPLKKEMSTVQLHWLLSCSMSCHVLSAKLLLQIKKYTFFCGGGGRGGVFHHFPPSDPGHCERAGFSTAKKKNTVPSAAPLAALVLHVERFSAL